MGNCFKSFDSSDFKLTRKEADEDADVGSDNIIDDIEEVKEIAKNSDFRELKRGTGYAYGNGSSSSEGVHRQHIDIPDAEHRSITLPQLRAVYDNVLRRCTTEKWVDYEGNPLTPDKVTLYDINRYVIKPFTLSTGKSFVECVATKPQKPKWFVSHWWGEPVKDFIACLEQHRRDFNEKDDVTYWICAYANNQWNLGDHVTADPAQSAFTKAMDISEGTISILDKDGVVFSRVWCIYELYRTLTRTTSSKWCIYTAHEHIYESWSRKSVKRSAVGIIPGGAPCDSGYQSRIIRREKHFPFHLIESSLNTKVEEAKASIDKDRKSILNSIVENHNLEMDPPNSHDKYTELNEALRAHFCASPRALQGAIKAGEAQWDKTLYALSKGRTMKIRMHFDFGKDLGWEALLDDDCDHDRAARLIAHLPPSLSHFSLRSAHFSSAFTAEFAKWIRKCTNLKRLDIYRSNIFPDDDDPKVGELLVDALASNDTIEHLDLDNTDLLKSKHIHHLATIMEMNQSLKHLECNGRDKIRMNDDSLCILARGIGLNDSLEKVEFRRHKFSNNESIGQLTQALLKNKTINYILMKGNKVDICGKMDRLRKELEERISPIEVEYIEDD